MSRFSLGPLWWFVIVGSVAGLAAIAAGAVRSGGYLLAATLAVAGLGRIALPERLIGALVIRSRAADGLVFLVLALLVALIFAVVKLTPLPA